MPINPGHDGTPTEGKTAGAPERAGSGPSFTPDTTHKVEQLLLRTLLTIPACDVLDTLRTLTPHDFHHPHLRIIAEMLETITESHDADSPVGPVALQVALQRAGHLADQSMTTELLGVSTGQPAPPVEARELATELRRARVRRGCSAVAGSLSDAARGGDDDVRIALHHVGQLYDLAARAGIIEDRAAQGGDNRAAS